MTKPPIYIGDWTSLNIHTVTNLFLYGQTTTPSHYQDRLRSAAEYNDLPVDPDLNQEIQVEVEMDTFMATGPGRYALASRAQVVQDFFNGVFTLPVQNQVYKIIDLAFLGYTYIPNDPANPFTFSIKHFEVDPTSTDFAERTYIYNSAGFRLSENIEFINNNGALEIRNMAVHAFNDDFDFSSNNPLTQFGNYIVLEPNIDPSGIGRQVQINFLDKQNVPTATYTAQSFNDDQTEIANTPVLWPTINPIDLAILAADMNDVIDDLQTAGTIDYETVSGGMVVYGSAENDTTVVGTVYGDILVAGDGNDWLLATQGYDTLYGGEDFDKADYSSVGAFLKVLTVPLEQGSYTVDKYYGQTSATGSYERDELFSIEEIIGDTDNGVTIDGAGGKFIKGDGEDNILTLPYQEVGAVTMYGYGGIDRLYGENNYNDYLVGGTEDDYLSGGGGADTYVYRRNDGNDEIEEYGSYNPHIDTLVFQGGITFAELEFGRYNSGEVVLIDIQGGGQVKLTWQESNGIDFLKFDDGTVVDMETVLVPVYGTSGIDFLVGTNDNGGGREGSLIHDVMYGYGGNDQLQGGTGNDHLYGGADTDSLSGGDGGDYLYGEGGIDSLNGGSGDDFLYGGDDNDTLRGNSGNDTYDGGSGNDTMDDSTSVGNEIYIFSGGLDSVYDYGGVDTLRLSGATTISDIAIDDLGNNINIVVSAGVDEILLKNFDYSISYKIENIEFGNGSSASLANHTTWVRGTSGNDTLAGAGSTPVIGYGGNDTLTGGTGADNLFGGSGDDLLVGGDGDDMLYGDSGIDTASYASASSAVSVNLSLMAAQNTGGAGSDIVSGFENVTGSAYNDTLTGDSIANTIDGGDGNDMIQGGAGNDILSGGAGTDTASYASALSGVYVNLGTTTAQNTGGGGTDTLSGFEKLTGSAFNDTLIGTNSANTLNGGDGDDILEGRGANDTLNGGNGLDTASYSTATGGVTVSLDITGGQNTGGAGTDTLSSMTNLIGSAYGDTLTGNEDDNTMEGLAGNDTLDGDAGTDTLSYANAAAGITMNLATTTAQNTIGAGTDTITNFENILASGFNDTLTGNGSGNVIEGGAGDDVMDGAGGTDTASYKLASSAVTVSLNVTTAQNTGGAGTDTISNIERLVGSAFSDDLSGNGSNNQIEGGLGDDVMNGKGGTDTLAYQTALSGVTVDLSLTAAQNTGGAGTDTISNFESITGSSFNDTLSGNSGTNTLKGGNGDDVLSGAGGADNLYGDAGADTFLFEAATAYSAIANVKDFSLSQADKIDIRNLLTDYDPMTELLTYFVQIQDSGANSTLSVDRDGAATTYSWAQIATLEAITGLTDESALVTSGNLLVV